MQRQRLLAASRVCGTGTSSDVADVGDIERRAFLKTIAELGDPMQSEVGKGWLLVSAKINATDLFEINDHVASQGLTNCDDGSVVSVLPLGERWPEERVKSQGPAQT
jgi:hypothetical protein